MSLLKSIIGDAVSKGIKKGIGDAIGKAVEGIVKPSVDKYAQKQADRINAAGESLEQGTAEMRQATAEAAQKISTSTTTAASSATGGLAGLEAALGGWAKRAESLATEMSKNTKICPQCGEVCTADKQFCPKCGAKLPEETTAAGYTCPKCGEVNTPGSKHCCKCGTILPAAEAEAKAQAAADAAVLDKFKQSLPQYPEWTVGGYDFELTDGGTCNGHPCYQFAFEGTIAILDQYVAKLQEAGFTYRDGRPSSGLLYKQMNGVCRCFNKESVCDTEKKIVSFYVDNTVLPTNKATEPHIPDVGDLAKGLFKKMF